MVHNKGALHKQALIEHQRIERKQLVDKTEKQRITDAKDMQARFRKGAKGFWDRVRGEYKRIQQRNEREVLSALQRDRAGKDSLTLQHIEQRQKFDAIKQREESRFVKQHQTIQHENIQNQSAIQQQNATNPSRFEL